MDVPLFPTFPVLGGHAVYRTRSAHGNLRGAGRTDGGTQASLTAMTTIFWRRSPFIGRRAGQAYISHVRMAIQHHFCANDLLKKSTRFGGPEFAYEITTVKKYYGRKAFYSTCGGGQTEPGGAIHICLL